MAKAIAALLRNPGNWTQKCMGRYKDGTPCNDFNVLLTQNPRTGEWDEVDHTKYLTAFSLYGAIMFCYESDRREFILEKLRVALKKLFGLNVPLAEFNDRPETTHKDILRLAQVANV